MTGVVIGARLIHGVEGELNVLGVARVQVVHNQVALADVCHGQVWFGTLRTEGGTHKVSIYAKQQEEFKIGENR